MALVLSLLVLGVRGVNGQVPSFIFVAHAGGGNSTYGLALATDATGNCFVTGSFYGPATFGTNNLSGYGGGDIFVAKYDAGGTLLWLAEAGGTNADTGNGVAVDAAGNCYVTGTFSGVASFGPTNLVGSMAFAAGTMFVAKYDPLGNLVWAREAVSDQGCYGNAIAADTNGDCYVTGAFVGTARFGGVTITNPSPNNQDNIFLAKYDADGNVLWVKQAGGIWYDAGADVAVDPTGTVYNTGYVGSADNRPNMFVSKYDGAGDVLWSTRPGGSGESAGQSVAWDSKANVLVTGYFSGTVSFGAVTLTSVGNEDAFLAKYGSDGFPVWVRQLGATNGSAAGSGIATDSSGNSYLSGGFAPSLSTGLTNLAAVGGYDGFIAKYDAEGNLTWILQIGGRGYNYPMGVSSSPGFDVYLTGTVGPGTQFGSTPLDTSASESFFLTRIDELPILSVTNAAGNVVISWPTNQVGFVLEWTGSLTPPLAWSTNTNPVQISGDHYTVTDQLSAAAGFYRLSKP